MSDQWPVNQPKRKNSFFRPSKTQRWLIILILIPLIWFLHTL